MRKVFLLFLENIFLTVISVVNKKQFENIVNILFLGSLGSIDNFKKSPPFPFLLKYQKNTPTINHQLNAINHYLIYFFQQDRIFNKIKIHLIFFLKILQLNFRPIKLINLWSCKFHLWLLRFHSMILINDFVGFS
jgi:hypothetical protein